MIRLVYASALENAILDAWGCDPAYFTSDEKCGEQARADVRVLEWLHNAPSVEIELEDGMYTCRDGVLYKAKFGFPEGTKTVTLPEIKVGEQEAKG